MACGYGCKENWMCRHTWRQINEVKVCIRCGLTLAEGSRPFFDRKIVSYYQKKKGAKAHG